MAKLFQRIPDLSRVCTHMRVYYQHLLLNKQ